MNAAPPARIICVLGMHRSGTSLIARLVNLLGVDLGPDPCVLTSGVDNPKGYWEYRPFVDVNDAIFERFGGSWNHTPDFPPAWWLDPAQQDFVDEARALVARDFTTPLWGWKDPRACVTMPFWQHALGPMRYVFCLRNPGAVIASLARREEMSSAHAERLWLTHLREALAATSGQPRLFLSYEELIADWRPGLRRLAAFIGQPAQADDPRVRDAVDSFLEAEMCHHHITVDDLASDERLSFPTKSLYLALHHESQRSGLRERDAAASPDEQAAGDARDVGDATDQDTRETPDPLAISATLALDALDAAAALAVDRDAQHAAYDALARQHEQQAAAVEALTAEILRASASHDAAYVTLAAERAVFSQRQEESARALAERDATLETMLAVRETEARARADEARERATLARERTELSATLDEIRASAAWRAISLTRSAIVALLPPGTRRRRAFHAIARRFARRPPVDRADQQAGADVHPRA